MNLLERVQPLLGELTEKITELVDELVREGIRDRLSAVLDDIGERAELEAVAPTRSKKSKAKPRAAKSIAKPRGGSQPCGVCHKVGHNRRTCPDREDDARAEEPKAPPQQSLRNIADKAAIERDLKPAKVIQPAAPIATKPVVNTKPPPPSASTKLDRFARIQAAADRRNGAGE